MIDRETVKPEHMQKKIRTTINSIWLNILLNKTFVKNFDQYQNVSN